MPSTPRGYMPRSQAEWEALEVQVRAFLSSQVEHLFREKLHFLAAQDQERLVMASDLLQVGRFQGSISAYRALERIFEEIQRDVYLLARAERGQ